MPPTLPDDVLLSIAAHLSDEHSQSLLGVHPTFCHLAMRHRYKSVTLTDEDPDNLGRVHFISYLERLRDPFVSGYVREVNISIKWVQKHWKQHPGLTTYQPTPAEQSALLTTLAALPALQHLTLDWRSRPDPSTPPFSALTSALGAHVTHLALIAPPADLAFFARAACPRLTRQLTHLRVLIACDAPIHGPAPDLLALGQFIALAADSRLSSLSLTLASRLPARARRVLLPCLQEMAKSTLHTLAGLELALPLDPPTEAGGFAHADALCALLARAAPRLQSLALTVQCPASTPLAHVTRWRARLAPLVLPSLTRLNLGWSGDASVNHWLWPRGAPHDAALGATLPWLARFSALRELCVGEVVLSDDSALEGLMGVVRAACPALRCLRVLLERVLPGTVEVLAREGAGLEEVEVRFRCVLPATMADDMDDVGWACQHGFWPSALDAYASRKEVARDPWRLRTAALVCTRPFEVPLCSACEDDGVAALVAFVRLLAPAAEVSFRAALSRHPSMRE